MNNREALIRAIIENPNEDTPRLIFADYLEEIGEEDRSSFIRVQVELARGWPILSQVQGDLENVTADARFFCLRRRERELLKLCWTPYFRHLFPEPHGIEVGELTMRWAGRIEAEPVRGFISSLTCSWADWLRHSPVLYWHEKQTVECPKCVDGVCNDMDIGDITFNEWPCENCGGISKDEKGRPANVPGTGRIPKPFPPTAQPLEEVRLTTWPERSMERHDLRQRIGDHFATGLKWFETRQLHLRFDRATCRTCDGQRKYGPNDWQRPCPTCRSVPLNEWRCDEWPGLLFRMPE